MSNLSFMKKDKIKSVLQLAQERRPSENQNEQRYHNFWQLEPDQWPKFVCSQSFGKVLTRSSYTAREEEQNRCKTSCWVDISTAGLVSHCEQNCFKLLLLYQRNVNKQANALYAKQQQKNKKQLTIKKYFAGTQDKDYASSLEIALHLFS